MPLSKIIDFDGLGTHWQCEIIDTHISDSKYDIIKKQLIEYLNKFTGLYSRFDDTSLVGRLNADHQLVNPPIEMINMLEFAREMFLASDGAFNISVGGDLASMGYGVSVGKVTSRGDFWEDSVISSKKIEIPDDIAVDFGGFGKGWLIDAFAEIFRKNNVQQFIVNGGGDLYVQADKYIEIALEHPFDSTKIIGNTRIKKGALAVSSVVKRSWMANGVRYHHIIDPKTNSSSDSGVISSFVKADTALIADTIATILIIKPELDQKLSKKFSLQTILLSADQFDN